MAERQAAPKKIRPSDATIGSVIADLPDPEDYICNVLKHMWGNDGDDCTVRIAITGRRNAPNYRLWMVMDRNTSDGVYIGAFDGKTHQPYDEQPFGVEEWSTAKMNFGEVQGLLKIIRSGPSRIIRGRPARVVSLASTPRQGGGETAPWRRRPREE